MNKKLALTIASSLLSVSMLGACGTADNNEFIEPENVRYDNNVNDRNGMLDRDANDYNGVRNVNDRNGINDRNNGLNDNMNIRNNDLDLDNGMNNDRNGFNNNGNGIFNDTNDRLDSPYRMDEEEPDLDEEPSEERNELFDIDNNR